MVICLERGADLHMAQLMPLPLAVFCFSKIQIGFTFLVLAHPGSPGKRAVKRVCVYHVHVVVHEINKPVISVDFSRLLPASLARALCNISLNSRTPFVAILLTNKQADVETYS